MRFSDEMLKSRDARIQQVSFMARRGTKPLRPCVNGRPGHLEEGGQLRNGQLVEVEEVREPFGELVAAKRPAERYHLTLLWAGSAPLREPRPCQPGAEARSGSCHAAAPGAGEPAAAGTWGPAAAEE